MAVDGNWNITMSTPMGERKATLTLLSSGGTLTGTQGADGNSTEIFDGAISGDAVNWKVSITNPMPLTLEFIGKVSGDSMSGEMGIGPMGSFPFTGIAGVTEKIKRLSPRMETSAAALRPTTI